MMEKMNLEKKTYKNYKELCEAMDWQVKSGNTKKAQMKELNRYCIYHKVGNSFIIDEVFEESDIKECEDIRNKYNKYIEKLILHELSKRKPNKEKRTINIAKNTLYKKLYMVNQNYNLCRNEINKFSRYVKVPTTAVYDFFNNTSGKLKDNVERTLNKLQNQCLIKWEYKTAVRLRTGSARNATDEEINMILEAERSALFVLEEKCKSDVFKKGKWNDFQKEVEKQLEDTNIMYYFKTFYINTTKEFREMLLGDIDLELYRNELNSTLYLSTIETARRKGKKVRDKYLVNSLKNGEYFMKPKFENERVQISDEYIDFTKRIASNVIDIDCIDIKLGELSGEKYKLAEYINDMEFEKNGNYWGVNYFDDACEELFG
jgi:hypothetical protein